MKQEKQLRECKKHGNVYFGHYKDNNFKDGYRWRCTKCVCEAVVKRKQKVKQTLVDENGGGCQICGYNKSIWALEFHHIDPSQKSFAINMGKGVSLDRFREEAKKCILLCSNCHREVEHGITKL